MHPEAACSRRPRSRHADDAGARPLRQAGSRAARRARSRSRTGGSSGCTTTGTTMSSATTRSSTSAWPARTTCARSTGVRSRSSRWTPATSARPSSTRAARSSGTCSSSPIPSTSSASRSSSTRCASSSTAGTTSARCTSARCRRTTRRTSRRSCTTCASGTRRCSTRRGAASVHPAHDRFRLSVPFRPPDARALLPLVARLHPPADEERRCRVAAYAWAAAPRRRHVVGRLGAASGDPHATVVLRGGHGERDGVRRRSRARARARRAQASTRNRPALGRSCRSTLPALDAHLQRIAEESARGVSDSPLVAARLSTSASGVITASVTTRTRFRRRSRTSCATWPSADDDELGQDVRATRSGAADRRP